MSQSKGPDLFSDVWPQERDVMERPERLRYVRRLSGGETCVFCDSLKKGLSAESLIVDQTANTFTVLNKYPYNNGHLLVLPKAHKESLLDLDEVTYTELSLALRKALKVLQQAYGSAGYNLGMNMGQVAGAGIPGHLHWHAIPRWIGDTNFFPLIAETKVVVETLQMTYDKLRPYFERSE